MRAMLLLFALWYPTRATAQSCPPVPPSGPAPAWFDFQVDTPARLVSADTTRPVPVAARDAPDRYSPAFALVQFIVDTTGQPVVRSLRILIHPAALDTGAVRSALARWQYTPAVAHGCRVAQLVQTPLRW